MESRKVRKRREKVRGLGRGRKETRGRFRKRNKIEEDD